MNKYLIIVFLLVLYSYTGFSQNFVHKDTILSEHVSCGLGIGLEYANYGGHVIFFPQRNIGIFFSLGDAIVGVAYEVGLKLRLIANLNNIISPYLIGMYGYNFAAIVTNIDSDYGYDLNRVNFGTTLGAGLDFRFKRNSNKYLSLAVLFPNVNKGVVNNYRNFLQQNYDESFSNTPSSVMVSIGFNIIIPY